MAAAAIVWLSVGGASGPPTAPVAAPVAPSSSAPTPAGSPSAGSAGSSTQATAPQPDGGAPTRITIGDLDIEAPVVPVGVDEFGEMAVPLDVRTVGWYRFGPGPGSDAGSSVLSGHVNDREQGEGAFFRLSDATEGDPVQVTLEDGTVLDYVVTSVERINKDELPVDELFARDGAPRVTLVTCGGDFDRERRSFRENVVVEAEPVAV